VNAGSRFDVLRRAVLFGFRNPIVVLAFLIVISLMILIAGGILGIDRGALRNMANPEYARGLITFLFAIVTIGTALVLVVSALISPDNSASEKQFQHGKEVFSLLLGVFGTVVGYYFGSTHAGTAVTELKVSEIMVFPELPQAGQQVTIRALIAGGTAPCQYSITLGDDTPKKDTDIPDCGMVTTHMLLPPNANSPDMRIELKVTDSAGHQIDRKAQIKLITVR
jgi:hypothetical protein